MMSLCVQDTIVLTKSIPLPPNGIICAHPKRVKKIADKFLKNTMIHTDYRGYQIYVGDYQDQRVFVANTGIGAPAAAFLIEELIAFGAKRIIRVGSNDSNFNGYKLNLVQETTVPLGLKKDYKLLDESVEVDQYLRLKITMKAHKLGIELIETINEHIDGYYADFKNRTGSSDMETGALYLLGHHYQLKYASILMSYPKHGATDEKNLLQQAYELENMAIKVALLSL